MNRTRREAKVSIHDALIFISKRAEDNIKRLQVLEKTLEEVSGEDGGEQEFEKLKINSAQYSEKVDVVLNRLTNLETKVTKNMQDKRKKAFERMKAFESKVINSVLTEKGNNNIRIENILEQFNLLKKEFEQLKEVVHKSNQVNIVVKGAEEE